ncbi:MAG: hypothetical protein V4621_07915 [Pseudomonadota bacterium]
MAHWNYRVIKTVEDEEELFGIHEVHYDDKGTPYAYTERASGVVWEAGEDAAKILAHMANALTLPVLMDSDFKWEPK